MQKEEAVSVSGWMITRGNGMVKRAHPQGKKNMNGRKQYISIFQTLLRKLFPRKTQSDGFSLHLTNRYSAEPQETTAEGKIDKAEIKSICENQLLELL